MYLFIFILLLCLTTKTYLSPQIPAHRCTLPWPYLFIFILYFRLNAKIYPSTFLQLCILRLSVYFHVSLSSNHKDLSVTTCTRVPIYIYTSSWATCSFSYFNSDKPLRSTRQRFYCAAWLCLSVYFHVSLSSNHKDLPVTTCTRVPTHIYIYNRSWYELPVHFHTSVQINR